MTKIFTFQIKVQFQLVGAKDTSYATLILSLKASKQIATMSDAIAQGKAKIDESYKANELISWHKITESNSIVTSELLD